MNIVKRMYKIYTPISIRRKISYVLDLFFSLFWKEKKVKLGNMNSNNTFYVIRYKYLGGIFGLITNFIPRLLYAEKNNYIPVIDMKNYKNMYLSNEDIGKNNSWEYYFNQPSEYSIEDVYLSSNVILSNGLSNFDSEASSIFFDINKQKEWKRIFNKYVHINSYTTKYIDVEYKKIIKESDKVLGVLCRGTDYLNLKPKNHPIQPDLDEIIKDIKSAIFKYKYNKIFLATEDENIRENIYFEFGNKVIMNQKIMYCDTGNEFLPNIQFNDKGKMFRKGLEYIAAIFILSKCNGLIAGQTAGSLISILLNDNKYEYEYVYNLGLYK